MNDKNIDVAALEAALKYERRRLKLRNHTGIGVILFGFLFAFTAFMHGVWLDAHPLVPDVSGTDQEEAAEILADSGFQVTTEEVYSNTAEKGQVVSQSPEATARAPVSSNIVLTVSMGREPVVLEAVVGLSEEDAEASLTKLGAVVTIRKEFSDSVEKDYVISQSPEAGESIIPGEEVVILVSKGTAGIEPGNTVGMTVEEAETLLKSLSLPYRIEESYGGSTENGLVIAQSWDQTEIFYNGKNVSETDPLVITVSTEGEIVSLPDIYGLNADQAQTLLESKGFQVTRSEEFSKSIGKGYVISMTPEIARKDASGNSVIYKGDTIHLVVSLGKN